MLARPLFQLTLWSILTVIASGCAEELGPERMETTRVTGIVREGRTPLKGGWIEFAPTDGTVGNLRSAPIGQDGRFEASGVAVGKNRIGLTGAPIQIPRGRQSFGILVSRIHRTIAKDSATDLTIDLLEEAIRDQQGR